MKILWPEKNKTRKWKQKPIPFMDIDTKILNKNENIYKSIWDENSIKGKFIPLSTYIGNKYQINNLISNSLKKNKTIRTKETKSKHKEGNNEFKSRNHQVENKKM